MTTIEPVNVYNVTSSYTTNKIQKKSSGLSFKGNITLSKQIKEPNKAIKYLTSLISSLAALLGISLVKNTSLMSAEYMKEQEKNPELVKILSEKTHTWGEDNTFESRNFTPKEIVEICKIFEDDPITAFNLAKLVENKYDGPGMNLSDEQVDYLIEKVKKDSNTAEYFSTPYPQETVTLLKTYDNYPNATKYLYETRKNFCGRLGTLSVEDIAELAESYEKYPDAVEFLAGEKTRDENKYNVEDIKKLAEVSDKYLKEIRRLCKYGKTKEFTPDDIIKLARIYHDKPEEIEILLRASMKPDEIMAKVLQ